MKSKAKVFAGVMLAAAGFAAGTLPYAVVDAQTTPQASTTPPPGAQHWGHRGHGFGPAHMFFKLDLTAEQKASMKSILTESAPAMKALHEQMRANMEKLRQTTPDDASAYEAAVTEVSQSAGTLHTQMVAADANLYAKLYALLTPAQKTQLAALQAKWQADAAERMQERMQRGSQSQ
jgi:Spy/CpxP family protein refolding chaperone